MKKGGGEDVTLLLGALGRLLPELLLELQVWPAHVFLGGVVWLTAVYSTLKCH